MNMLSGFLTLRQLLWKAKLTPLIVITVAANVVLSVGPALKRDFFLPGQPPKPVWSCNFLLGTWPHASLLDQTPIVSH